MSRAVDMMEKVADWEECEICHNDGRSCCPNIHCVNGFVLVER